MPINNFDFPGVSFRQTFDAAPANTLATLGVACVGTQYKLHKADSADAVQLELTYNPSSSSTATIPVTQGAVVDTTAASQHLVVKNGVFKYATISSSITLTAASRTLAFDEAVANGGGYTADETKFGTRGVRVGDPIQLTGTGSGSVSSPMITTVLRLEFTDGKGFNKIVVGDVDSITTVSAVDFCVLDDMTYEADKFSLSGTTLTVNSGLTKVLDDPSDMVGTLLDGDFYFEFRESVSDYVNKLGIVSSNDDIEEMLGTPCKDNPLALAVKFAFDSSNSIVYFTGIANETAESYEDAIEFLAKYDGIYSIVPVTEDKSVINACITVCKRESEDEESTIRRAVWYGVTHDAAPTIWTGTCTTTANSTAVTVASASDLPYSDTAFKAGDKLKLLEAPYTEFALAGINGANLTLTANAGVALSAKPFAIIRTVPTSSDIIDDVIARRANASERAVCVWADGLQYNGENLPNYPLAAAAAGMRCAEYPHRPLSNLGYTSFTLAEPCGLSKAQMKRIGANGIWIIANNQDGTPINMRQVTTAVANNINLDEESIIANVDTIAMTVCQVGRNYVGNSNISPSMLNLLDSDLRSVMDSFLKNTSGSPYIGPQLIDWELVSIYQDEVNKDHVYANFNCEPPKPFNRFVMTMRVI